MKKLLLILCLTLLTVVPSMGQMRGQFNPEKFQADLEHHILITAQLTEQESARFLPVYREMRQKQVVLMRQRRQLKNNKNAAEVIRQQDQIDLKLKKIQQQYHERFLKIIPAEKVLKVIVAEDNFHRQAFKKRHP